MKRKKHLPNFKTPIFALAAPDLVEPRELKKAGFAALLPKPLQAQKFQTLLCAHTPAHADESQHD